MSFKYKSLKASNLYVKQLTAYDYYLATKGYFVGQQIDSGSFATVHHAEKWQQNNVEELAVKIIEKSKSSRRFLKKFLPREMLLWPKLKHRFIIEAREIFHFPERIYVFMELATGGSVIDYLQANGAVSEDLGRVWSRNLCQALKYCHQRGIAHRDVKCDNLLICKDFSIKLGDFGFCCLSFDPFEKKRICSRTFCGSSAYVAPEVITGDPYDPLAADVWSAGVCVFVLLNNGIPFDDSNMQRMHDAQLVKKWKFAPQIDSKLSPQLKRMLSKMLEPDPCKRITIEEVLQNPWIK